MAKRFSLRQFFNKHPALDKLRIKSLSYGAAKGTMFWCGCFNANVFYSPAAQEALFGEERRPLLFALYHGHMAASMYLPFRHKITSLASASRDGQIIGLSAHVMGFAPTAFGSPAHDAVKGAMGMVHAAQKGRSLMFFVDGPRGPKEEVKPGVIRLSQMARTPIVPVVCQARHYWSLPSWDSYHFPHWSSPYVQLFGDPIDVPEELDNEGVEAFRTQLDNTMRDLTVRARQLAQSIK